MHFSDSEAALLKAWIVKRLENTSDADPDVLADYVLALLRHEGSADEVRKLCEEEIPDFLKEESTVFLDDVFDAVAYKSYLPGAPPAPKLRPNPNPNPNPASAPAAPASAPQVASRKRAYPDGDEFEPQGNGHAMHERARGAKQPRRHNNHGFLPSAPAAMQGGAGAPMGAPPQFDYDPMSLMPMLDASIQAYAAMQQSFGAAAMPPRLQRLKRGSGPKRGRCRDYDAQGFCTRGNTCRYEHGPRPGFDALPPPSHFEGYDPTNASLMLPGPNVQQMMQATLPQMPYFPPPEPRNGKAFKNGRGRRSQLSADGPVHDRSRSTIVVENIPEENFTEEQVRAFFSQFGPIVSVSMQPYKRLAVVKYETWAAANAAYRSPKVIFDNRFVRVFWFKEGDKEQPKPTAAESAAAGPGTQGGAAQDANGNPDQAAAAEPEVDMAEFARRQDEAQKAFEDKRQKRDEVERRRQELEQRQKELTEERRKLNAKLAAKSSDGASGLSSVTTAAASGKAESKETMALRATLAALEEEARLMGLDPEEAAEPPTWPPGPYRGRGAYRGRGRGAPPPPYAPYPGPYPPRGGFRGAYRGGRGRGAGSHHAAYAMYSLDHRPRRVAVSGVDFSAPEKDEALRQHLLGVGEFSDVKVVSGGAAHVTFNDRKTAEAFYNGLAGGGGGGAIPGIDEPLELTWLPDPSATAAAAAASVVAGGSDADAGGRGGANADKSAALEPGEIPGGDDDDALMDDAGHNGDGHANLDYDYADDEENWDVA